MSGGNIERRDFIKYVLGGISMMALDWGSLPRRLEAATDEDVFDAIVVGSGLGGLSCAAAFARQGFHVLVLEQHDKPGGYATAFERPGGYLFDVSLHSTGAGERDGIHNLIPGLPEIKEVEFVPHPNLYRAIFPEHDIRVPQRNLPAYIDMIVRHFPEEEEGIRGLFADMQGLADDISRLSTGHGQIDMSRFAVDFPYLAQYYNKTWKDMLDARVKDPKLRAILSAQWGYYGLPPSRLVSFYYALPAIGYLTDGGYYPRGRSQTISNAMVKFINDHGGKVLVSTPVEKILTKDHAVHGVRTRTGKEYRSRVVVSNVNPVDTFKNMVDDSGYLSDYMQQLGRYNVSLSCFQVFLGLKDDVVRKNGIKDSEIFFMTGYDPEADYESALKADTAHSGYSVSLYDNIYDGYSPAGKNTINIITLQGFDHWAKYEDDYFKGEKSEYRKEKERIAAELIGQVERTLLPGLSAAIEVEEIGTPLTNLRYTRNLRGAIYGWDQTVDNSGNNRLGHETPVKNLYLAGAWTKPGHGYGGVIASGLQCFGEIMRSW